MPEERLQKILRSAGVTSRRKAEALIAAGRVRVDGQIVTELGTKANPRSAKVEFDGQRLQRETLCYGVMHKPRGMVTTLSDPEGRPTAQDILKQVGVRVIPIGRLDFNTSGALLFTNDGDFAQALSHASGKVPKVYAAKVQQIVDDASLARWAEAIEIEGNLTRPAQIRILRREGDKTWLEVTLAEGKNRQVRRLGEHAKTPVVRLARLSHAEITTEGLRPGQWRLLTVDELKGLKKRYGVPKKVHAQSETTVRPARKVGSAPKRPSKAAGRPSLETPHRGTQSSRSNQSSRSGTAHRGHSPNRGERPDGHPSLSRGGPSSRDNSARPSSAAKRSGPPQRSSAAKRSGPPQRSNAAKRSGPPQRSNAAKRSDSAQRAAPARKGGGPTGGSRGRAGAKR